MGGDEQIIGANGPAYGFKFSPDGAIFGIGRARRALKLADFQV